MYYLFFKLPFYEKFSFNYFLIFQRKVYLKNPFSLLFYRESMTFFQNNSLFLLKSLGSSLKKKILIKTLSRFSQNDWNKNMFFSNNFFFSKNPKRNHFKTTTTHLFFKIQSTYFLQPVFESRTMLTLIPSSEYVGPLDYHLMSSLLNLKHILFHSQKTTKSHIRD